MAMARSKNHLLVLCHSGALTYTFRYPLQKMGYILIILAKYDRFTTGPLGGH